MSTASGVVFAGDNEGNFMAFEARTGKNLWFYPTGSPIWGAAAMTFMIENRQLVLIGSGTNVTAFGLPADSPVPRPLERSAAISHGVANGGARDSGITQRRRAAEVSVSSFLCVIPFAPSPPFPSGALRTCEKR